MLMAIKRSPRPGSCHSGAVCLTKIERTQVSFALSQLLAVDLGAQFLGPLRDSRDRRFHPQVGAMVGAWRIRDFCQSRESIRANDALRLLACDFGFARLRAQKGLARMLSPQKEKFGVST